VKCVSQVAKDVIASHGTLVNLFERIQFFIERLNIYIGIPLTAGLTELFGKIMGQVLLILALSTKEMTQRRISERDLLDVSLLANYCTERFLNRLVGKNAIQDALDRLDVLTKEESGMTGARTLGVTHIIDDNVKVVEEATHAIDENVRAIKDGPRSSHNFISTSTNFPLIHRTRNKPAKTSVVPSLSHPRLSKLKIPTVNQSRRELHTWLAPPDPSVNHNTAHELQHHGTTTWFTESEVFKQWKSNGSLLWIRGNRTRLLPCVSLRPTIDLIHRLLSGIWKDRFLVRIYCSSPVI
jgi:chromosome condensin MukBEF MukE localization factor